MLSVCLCFRVPLIIVNQIVDFYEIRYGGHAIEGGLPTAPPHPALRTALMIIVFLIPR
jgi:hypothetical protein